MPKDYFRAMQVNNEVDKVAKYFLLSLLNMVQMRRLAPVMDNTFDLCFNDKDKKIESNSRMWDATREIEHIQLVPENTQLDEILIHL